MAMEVHLDGHGETYTLLVTFVFYLKKKYIDKQLKTQNTYKTFKTIYILMSHHKTFSKKKRHHSKRIIIFSPLFLGFLHNAFYYYYFFYG
jgi:hypothetical protein